MRGDYDAVVAMYHDQGLVPLKMVAFETGVNWTLGLPFIRTSPDHGTGLRYRRQRSGKSIKHDRRNPPRETIASKSSRLIGARTSCPRVELSRSACRRRALIRRRDAGGTIQVGASSGERA
jgi:hypothetical protein